MVSRDEKKPFPDTSLVMSFWPLPLQTPPEETARQLRMKLVHKEVKGEKDVYSLLEGLLTRIKHHTDYRHWCGEFLKPNFIKTASQLYPVVRMVEVWSQEVKDKGEKNKNSRLLAFCLWSPCLSLLPEFHGKIYTEPRVSEETSITLSTTMEILAWCSLQHDAGLLAVRAALDRDYDRAFMVETHDRRSKEVYLEAGFQVVHAKHHKTWKAFPDTLAIVADANAL